MRRLNGKMRLSRKFAIIILNNKNCFDVQKNCLFQVAYSLADKHGNQMEDTLRWLIIKPLGLSGIPVRSILKEAQKNRRA